VNIWFFIWLLLSAALLYFLGWTLLILVRQKRAWKAFAKKYKLRFKSRSFEEAPEMNGTIKDYSISFFTSEHIVVEGRSTRKMTAIEVNLQSKMPVDGAIASGKMVDIIREGFQGYEEYRPKLKGWSKDYIALGESKAVLAEYLSEDRWKALKALLDMKGTWVTLLFKTGVTILRIDTPYPLDSLKMLESTTKKMLSAAKELELKAGESAHLKSREVLKSSQAVSLELDDDGAAPAFELEEDELEAEPEPEASQPAEGSDEKAEDSDNTEKS